jgi:4-carboxymuconolactone decarboxylase
MVMDDAERIRQGMSVRREVLGDEHVDRAVAGTTAFTEPFQDFITRYAWGDIWSRPGLSRAERSIVTLAVLTALQHEGELAMHVKAALRNGLAPEQIQEVLLQVAVYAGVPAGNRAFAVAQRALAEAAGEAGEPAPGEGHDIDVSAGSRYRTDIERVCTQRSLTGVVWPRSCHWPKRLGGPCGTATRSRWRASPT